MTVLVVNSCGPRTSLQDTGRSGFQRYGVANSGAMDGLALAAANILVGNAPGTAAIELMLVGGSFGVEDGSTRIAVAGAPCAIALEGRPVAHSTAVAIKPGQTLTIGSMQAGVYAYLAVGGGFDWPADLGSLSLHQRAALGGFHGRAFQAGDRIPLGPGGPADAPVLGLPALPLDGKAPVRVVLGPQDDYFSQAGVATFLSCTYRVSQEADRMGYRLTGPRIEHSIGFNIVSDGIVSGSVQVPGSGEPIVMMADRQTTGGYPKIATVISADLRVVAQRRPGDGLRFELVGVKEAQQIARARVAQLRALAALARPLRDGLPPPEELLGLNLAGAAVDALARDS
jgi:5-oxoprolinase (ATP-hydrolysing) subunit C